MDRALEKGVDVVGGIPHFERTMSEGAQSIRMLCEIAEKRGLLVDMHCDESDDPMSYIAERSNPGSNVCWRNKLEKTGIIFIYETNDLSSEDILKLLRTNGIQFFSTLISFFTSSFLCSPC